jgi:hypothetical protein
MKFTNYQYLEDGVKTDLTDKQINSKFWGKGKWDNYVVPHFKEDVKGLTYVDMGTNAGLFLKFAEDMGFGRVVGMDINPDAVQRGLVYRAKVKGKYDLRCGKMQDLINEMPVADYMSFINSHYYLLIQEWLDLLAILRKKARYCIITAIKKKEYFCMASGYKWNIRRYFDNWELVNYVPQLPMEGDSCPRTLESFCFKNPCLERVELDKLQKGNHVQGRYYEEMDRGAHPFETRYFKILCRRKKGKPREDLEKWMLDKVAMYWSVKKYGIREPIIVNKHYKILDGNHRKEILEYLGYKTAIVRKV